MPAMVSSRFVLDASGLLSGKDFEGELFTSPHILQEARDHGLDARGEAMVEAKVRVVEARDDAVLRVRQAALRTGDSPRLSEPDVRILALALDLKATIVTDDYSIQNVAEELKVPYSPAGLESIRGRVKWYYRCSGCGRYFDEAVGDCPVCGSPVKTTRRPPRGQGKNTSSR